MNWRSVIAFGLLLVGGCSFGQTYIDLHDFGGKLPNGKPDGANPRSRVTLDTAQNIYSTCRKGGTTDYGVICKLSAAGAYVDVFNFGGTPNSGWYPNGDVALDSAGNEYGTCFAGGAYGGGLVWEITASGGFVDLHDFRGTLPDGKPDGWQPNSGVAFDTAGNMYGTCENGGQYGEANNGIGDGIVWEITKTGQYNDYHDFGGTLIGGTQDGGSPSAGVTSDVAGNIYGTCTGGGIYDTVTLGGTVWEITASGTYLILHDFGGSLATGAKDGYDPIAGVTVDAYGNLLGTCANGGTANCGTVWELIKGGNYLVLHEFSGAQSNGERDGQGPWGGVTLDAAGNMFGTCVLGGNYGGADGFGTVWEITESGTYLKLYDFGGTTPNGSPEGGTTPYAGVTLDAFGNIYGTCLIGGKKGAGTIWMISKSLPSSLSLDATNPIGGSISTGTILLTLPAPQGGLKVNLSSTSLSATVPHSVLVPSGQSRATFTVQTRAVLTQTSAKIICSVGSVSTSAALTIMPPGVESVALTPATVVGLISATGTVVLTGQAPNGGIKVDLMSFNSAATVPSSVTVPAGKTSAKFTIKTTAVASSTSVLISASYSGSAQSAFLTINPPVIKSISLNPASVVGGKNSTGTLTLGSPAPAGGITVQLSSSSGSTTIPATVTIAAGKTSATFTVNTATVSSKATATITASFGASSKSVNLTISP